jgi:O-antigen/teichoic acid export membrane protein
MTPTAAPEGLGPGPPTPTSPRLSRASVWNLSLNVFNKSQTVALLAAGSVIGGLTGIGVLVTAVAASSLGQALADFGLSGEVTRLNVAYPNRVTVDRSLRAFARQAPLALLVAPAVYIVLGPTSGSAPFLAILGLYSSCLVGTIGLTAILNGLGDFRAPAAFVGGARFLSSIAAVIAAAIEPTPMAVISAFAVGEAVGLATLLIATVRAKAKLPDAEHPEGRVRRARLWFGVAQIVNLMTNQADTLLVASILSPHDLGLFATASALENGVATFSLALAMPITLRSVGTTLAGEIADGARMLRRAFLTAASAALVLAVLTFVVALVTGDAISKLHGLANGDGPLVLGLCLAAAPIGVIADICVVTGAGFARHRAVGVRQAQAGVSAIAAIVAGAKIAGTVGAAAGTIVRDVARVLVTRGLATPPDEPKRTPAAAQSVATG